MSTLATADLSSDEEDTDFVPEEKGKTSKRTRSGSQSDSSDDDNDAEPEDDIAAKLRQEAADAADAARKQRALETFKAMQEEASAPKVVTPAAKVEEVELVEVRRPRRFAGETIYETVKLRKDDPEAVQYLAKQEKVDDASTTATAGGSEVATPASGSASPAPVPASSEGATSAPPRRPPPRKRPRQSLEAMAAAIDKGKKMTTLEKSQMDWNSHLASDASISDEVAQHRRGGGYLEKQAFLDRVGERRENAGSQGSLGRRR